MMLTSLICGTFLNTIGWSVSRQAARSGSAAFLFPAGVTSPFNGAPPSMTNFSMFSSGGISPRLSLSAQRGNEESGIVRQIIRYGKHITVDLHAVTCQFWGRFGI